MSPAHAKDTLHQHLDDARRAILWKLEGLSEYDVRRPLTAHGTNLLGLVKHLAGCEIGYFGEVFGRPYPDPPAWWTNEGEPARDMWATAEESRTDIIELYQHACAHSDTTIDTLDLDARGTVAPWPENRRSVTLHDILTHMLAETARHAGHADIVRELIDGNAGLHTDRSGLPDATVEHWQQLRSRIEDEARQANVPVGGGDPPGMQFVRRVDGLTYEFSHDGHVHGAASYRRVDLAIWCRRLPDFGWVVCNEAGAVSSRPFGDAGHGRLPPEGMWVSAKGDRSYVYDLVWSAAQTGGAGGIG